MPTHLHIFSIILATITMVSLIVAQDQIPSQSSNCTGFYYEDINAAFVDCYDKNGVIVSRTEQFYTSPLEKYCNSTDFATFNISLNGTSIMASVPSNMTVTYCDYFEVGNGYLFTQADDDIGLVVLNDRFGGVLDGHYEYLKVQPGVLTWDWQVLVSLIQNYSPVPCNNSAQNTSGATSGGAVWRDLTSIPWASWNMTAVSSPNPANWTKALWRLWVLWYVQYFDALHTFLGDAAPANNPMPASTSANATSGMVSSANTTEVVLLNFTAIWIPLFDEASTTAATVVADLNATSSIITDTLAWYQMFFGPQGFVTLNITLPSNISMSNCSTGINVPPGLDAIVNWITLEVKEEIIRDCPTCNVGGANNSNGV